jgi:uracil-DNA glycosylase
MSLMLDERRAAMLAEMGIRVVAAAPQADTPPPAIDAIASQAVRASPPAARAAPLVPRAAGVELMAWDELAQAVAGCRACKLCGTRRNTVFGVGDQQADWLIVGEAPGENEDAQGEPFVGQAGKLLDNMLRAVGLDRQHKVYIANVLKCRPPGNRNPETEEVAQCEPFLRRQVQLLQPKIIIAMGRFAVQSLLGTTDAIGRLRGQRHQYQGVPVVVTYHPAYLLRSLPDKAKAWADLCFALEIVNGQPG